MPIVPTKFKRVAKESQKSEKVISRLPKIKVKAQGAKALADEKKENKLKEQEEHLNRVDKVALSTKKGKAKKIIEEYCKEFEKEMVEEEEE